MSNPDIFFNKSKMNFVIVTFIRGAMTVVNLFDSDLVLDRWGISNDSLI